MAGARLLLVALALVSLLAWQLAPVPAVVQGHDKEGHVAAYYAVGLLLWWVIPAPVLLRSEFVLLGGAALGVLAEVLQGFSPGRTPDRVDVLADLVGLTAAVLALAVGGALANAEQRKDADPPSPPGEVDEAAAATEDALGPDRGALDLPQSAQHPFTPRAWAPWSLWSPKR